MSILMLEHIMLLTFEKYLRSKQLGDCEDTTEDMTVDRHDSKDLPLEELADEHRNNSDEPNDRQHTSQQENDEHNTIRAAPKTDSEMTESNARLSSSSPRSIGRQSPETQKDIEINTSSRVESTTSPKHNALLTSSQSKIIGCSIIQDNSSTSNTENERMPSSSPTIQQNLSEGPVTPTSKPSSPVVPKLRLNALLASDPALKPDAKDLKTIHDEAQLKQQCKNNSHLPAPPALLKQEKFDAMVIASQTQNTPESTLIKPTGTLAPSAEITPRIKVFMCLPCGIGFSSPSTLEAHQAYYCSHRNKDADENSSAHLTTITEKRGSPNSSSNTGNSGAVSNSTVEPVSKALKTGKQYACTQCSYSADKKVSLNRHMRMHQTSPATSSNASANGGGMLLSGTNSNIILEDSSSQQIDRYCSDCDIRFSNIKTYRAHKQHYCSSRRTEGQLTPKLEVSTATSTSVAKPANIVNSAMSPQTRTKTPTQAMAAAAAAAAAVSLQSSTQPFVALPTNPILIIPYALIRVGNLIPGPPNTTAATGAATPENTCFMFDNGSWKPIATALNMNSIGAAASTSNTASPSSVLSNNPSHSNKTELLLNEKNNTQGTHTTNTSSKAKEPSTRETAPLDLSLRRSPIATLQQRLHAATSFLDVATPHHVDMDILLEAGKENLSLDDTGSITPEQIVCAPSLPNSPSMSPSPKRRAISPRSSGAGSSSSMSPPTNVVTSLAAAAAANNILDGLPLRPILPADIALKFSESNIINPHLLTKQNLELAFKLSAAAAVVNSSGATGATPAEIAAAAVAAASKSTLLGLPVLSSPTNAVAAAAAAQPQIYVKQGVSKCKECNIVFCKYENYLVHKQHYCSARNQDTNENETKTANTPPIPTGSSAVADTTTMSYQQLICAACGIKYTSLDNLRAHQNFYCLKGNTANTNATPAALGVATTTTDGAQITLPKEKCTKCKSVHERSLPCPPPPALQQPVTQMNSNSSSGGNVYKCPLCDAVSLTANESRKHMETHGSVKAFRCSICRYKGNTLRGMRTHIRMHFDKKTNDFNEEHYMSCILEDESVEIPSAASLNQEQLTQQLITAQQQVVAAAAANLQSQQQQQQQVFNCDICNYSSSYKGNVLRHIKLVHPQLSTCSPSVSPESAPAGSEVEVATDSNSHTGSLNDGENTVHSFVIKSEPFDVLPVTTTSSQSNVNENNNSPPVPLATAVNDLQTTIQHIKSEPLDIVTESVNSTTLQRTQHSPATIAHVASLMEAAPHEERSNTSQKYCQTCDISFNYMKTFLAHKQFYCKGKIRQPELHDERTSPTAVMSIIPSVSPNSSLLLQKNKENLQQEAAI